MKNIINNQKHAMPAATDSRGSFPANPKSKIKIQKSPFVSPRQEFRFETPNPKFVTPHDLAIFYLRRFPIFLHPSFCLCAFCVLSRQSKFKNPLKPPFFKAFQTFSKTNF
jgi:hypothetical protein